tara:strand:+ start:52 stop:1224 length:1173 start_codon:yes stop_codon:yes gene_type:complete
MKKIIGFLFLFVVFFIAFQPFIPKETEFLFIALKLIILPALILFYCMNDRFKIWIFLSVVYFLFVLLFTDNYSDMYSIQIISLNILVMVSYYIFGYELYKNSFGYFKAKYLLYSVNILNLSSLFFYLLVFFGYLSLEDLYELISKEFYYDNLSRFSLGNAIEFPFTITTLLFLYTILKNDTNILLSASLNLLMSFISESRIVILISILLLALCFKNLPAKKIISYLIIIFIVYYFSLSVIYQFEFDSIYESVVSRFSGDDSGSGYDRAAIFREIYEKSLFSDLIFGHGISYSRVFMATNFGSFRTVESLFLELLLDFGIIGFLIFCSSIFKLMPKLKLFNFRYNLIIILIFIQIFIFLPLHSNIGFCIMPIGAYYAYLNYGRNFKRITDD